MTASELFGFPPKQKKEDKKDVESKKEDNMQKVEEVVVKEEKDVKEIKEAKKEPEEDLNKKASFTNNHREMQNEGYKYQNKPRFDNNNRRNFGDNNHHQNGFNRNDRDGNNRNFDRNRYQNRNNFGNKMQGNRQNNNGDYKNNRRSLDEKGIEKNIKNIMAQDLGEKESVREYNRNLIKQKNHNNNNSQEETRQRKSAKTRRNEEFDSGKLKNLKQENRLSNMFGEEGGMLDYYDLTTVRGKKGKKKNNNDEERTKQKIFKLTEITIPESITVKDLAQEMKKTTGDIIKKLLDYGIMATSIQHF